MVVAVASVKKLVICPAAFAFPADGIGHVSLGNDCARVIVATVADAAGLVPVVNVNAIQLPPPVMLSVVGPVPAPESNDTFVPLYRLP